ncbi:MAG: hypothetical protein GY842_18470 [bacterium]|nr:hypothetical protein [bacterium]
MSILLAAMLSAIVVASHAMPDAASPAGTAIRTAEAADILVEELSSALWITDRQSNSVSFTVPDRDGDGAPETIMYSWSGTPGDPLLRKYSGGGESAEEFLADVHDFQLGYEITTETEEYPGLPVEGAEELLMSYNSGYDLADARIEAGKWWGQFFKPTFPPEAVSWRVNRVFFYAKLHDNNATTTRIQLRLPAADNTPSDTIVDETTHPQLSLTASFQWVEKVFANAGRLSVGQGLCLTFITDDNKSAKLRYRKKDVVLSDAGLSYDKPDWDPVVTDEALLFYVYGSFATPGPPQTATRRYVSAVRMILQAGEQLTSRVATTVQTVNSPELLSGMWETDFYIDPTLDGNGDGAGDWSLRQGGSFGTNDLVDGVWKVSGGSGLDLDTVPDNAFEELTTVELRYRCTGEAGAGVYFWINADYTGGNFMPIVATLDLLPDTTQELTVAVGGSNVVTVPGLAEGFVTLRLLIDPDLDTVNISVEGVDRGTYAYVPYAPTTDPQCATLHEWGSDAEFDYVSIRVAEP